MKEGFDNFMESLNFSQPISEPIRVTTTSIFITDLIMVSDNDKINRSGVITVRVSDHLLTYCIRKIKREVFITNKTVLN